MTVSAIVCGSFVKWLYPYNARGATGGELDRLLVSVAAVLAGDAPYLLPYLRSRLNSGLCGTVTRKLREPNLEGDELMVLLVDDKGGFEEDRAGLLLLETFSPYF